MAEYFMALDLPGGGVRDEANTQCPFSCFWSVQLLTDMLHGYLTAAEKLAVPDADILTDVDVKLLEDNGSASAQAGCFGNTAVSSIRAMMYMKTLFISIPSSLLLNAKDERLQIIHRYGACCTRV